MNPFNLTFQPGIAGMYSLTANYKDMCRLLSKSWNYHPFNVTTALSLAVDEKKEGCKVADNPQKG